MAGRIIVLILDGEDANRGEITFVEERSAAERLVEAALEAGRDASHVRLFAGSELEMSVRYRPVVSIRERESSVGLEAPVEGLSPDKAPPEDEAVEEVGTTAFLRDGVRFSSLFRSD